MYVRKAGGLLGAWIVAALTNVPPVLAEGYKVQLAGVKALGVGYAGRATADDAAVVWLNAAGMTELPSRWTLTFGAAVIPFSLDYRDHGSRSLLGQPMTGSIAINVGQKPMVPHGFLVYAIDRRWRLGFGFNAPYGLGVDYANAWVGRYYAGESSLAVANFSSALAFKWTDRLSLGVGLNVQRATTTLTNRIDFGSLGAALGLPLPPQGADGGIAFDGRSWGFGVDLSGAWRLTSRARLVATYREEIAHALAGDTAFDVPVAATPFAAGGAFRATRATAVLPMPREISVATAIHLAPDGEWTIVADATWTDWSTFDRLALRFDNPAQPTVVQRAHFTDSIRFGGGVIHSPTADWTLRAGGFFERTPVPDETRTPRLPEVDNVGVAVGGSYRLSSRWDLDFAWSHLIPRDAPIRLDDPSAGWLTGDVRWQTDSFALGLNVKF
jgi:long-chain fatty acid transport protein